MAYTHITLNITGMTCDACATHLSSALLQIPGVMHVTIPHWQAARAHVTTDSTVSVDALIQAVANAGCHATLHQPPLADPSPAQDNHATHCDLLVIGTGGAGMAAAIRGAELGYRVCIVEAGTIGGTCVNIGCVPSKTLIRAAEVFYKAGHHPFAGIHTRAEAVTWQQVIAQKNRLVGELRQSKYLRVLASYGNRITLVRGRARLTADGRVIVDDTQVFQPRRVVVATGARPRILPLQGIENVDVLTSTSAMALQELPASLLVIGGRAVALELGQTFARLGTRVTILQRSPRILPDHEPEISAALTEYLRQEGITVHTGVRPLAIRQEKNEKVLVAEVDGTRREFRAEQVLMATGRTPNTQDMGLSEAGILLDDNGFIIVNEYMQTNNPRIYAAGDVTTGPKLVYVAAAGGSIAAENALQGNQRRLDLRVLPRVVFTDPQVATVGLTEADARKQGFDVAVSLLPLSHVPRALAARDTRGLIKLVADQATDRLLGAHILAAEGGEVVQTTALAIKMGMEHGFTVRALREMLFPYLVQVEGLKLAALAFDKDLNQLSCCAG